MQGYQYIGTKSFKEFPFGLQVFPCILDRSSSKIFGTSTHAFVANHNFFCLNVAYIYIDIYIFTYHTSVFFCTNNSSC